MTETTTAAAVPTVDDEGTRLFGDQYADPILKLATDIYVGSLLLHFGAHTLPAGSTQVTVSATPAIPEDTPAGFQAANLLEQTLMDNPSGFSRKIDFPFEYVRTDFWSGLAKNTVLLPDRYDVFDFHVMGSTSNDAKGLRLELMSKKLNRAIYFDISAPG
jgi:hypothetical protein